ncbi:MAG: hypothetical protein E7590_04270 [Ruminococcaceae bacterium]|nr:hypothetical protein [Oscillospiraceae bacterium]
MAKSNGLRGVLDSLPRLIQILFIIFAGFIYGGLYRIAPLDLKAIVIGILWIITGGFFGIGWIIDIVTVILHGKPTILV